MADIRPFRGVTYNPERVNLDKVLCPPYDVISPRQQVAYMQRDDQNFVRIVLNPAEGEQRYAAAAADLRAWMANGTLRRDEQPGFYVHRHTFEVPRGPRLSRIGLLAAVRLEPWSARSVRPHEHTMPGPKEDRLALMRATQADTESIWVFHPDPERELMGALEAISASPPDVSAEFRPVSATAGEEAPERHEIWRAQHPSTVERLRTIVSRLPLYIADGHHRYETALHHAGEVGGGADDATRFKLMLLSATEDPGLLVLPTHRLVRFADGQTLGGMLTRLADLGWTTDPFGDLAGLQSRLSSVPPMGRLGFGLVAQGQYSWIQGAVLPGDTSALGQATAGLDVALLHEGVLRPLLGIGPDELALATRIAYSRDALEVESRVNSGEFDLGILVRAPTLEQVQSVADSRESMPQKSTYFWPKPASGLVMMPQAPGEGL